MRGKAQNKPYKNGASALNDFEQRRQLLGLTL
jgi:hypothetical protein